MDTWNHTGACCEGTVGTLLDGSKIVTLSCVMAYVNNMLCENNMLIYAE